MPFKPHPTDPTKVIYKTSEYWIPKPWQGLTDDEINKSWEWAQKSSPYGVTRIETFAKSIETKLKEKNNG